MKEKYIKPGECDVVLTSPIHYEECIVEVGTSEDLLFILSDENRSGSCIVELPGNGESIARCVPLNYFRRLLDAAEQKLTGR